VAASRLHVHANQRVGHAVELEVMSAGNTNLLTVDNGAMRRRTLSSVNTHLDANLSTELANIVQRKETVMLPPAVVESDLRCCTLAAHARRRSHSSINIFIVSCAA
jgi:hypothetical protein